MEKGMIQINKLFLKRQCFRYRYRNYFVERSHDLPWFFHDFYFFNLLRPKSSICTLSPQHSLPKRLWIVSIYSIFAYLRVSFMWWGLRWGFWWLFHADRVCRSIAAQHDSAKSSHRSVWDFIWFSRILPWVTYFPINAITFLTAEYVGIFWGNNRCPCLRLKSQKMYYSVGFFNLMIIFDLL